MYGMRTVTKASMMVQKTKQPRGFALILVTAVLIALAGATVVLLDMYAAEEKVTTAMTNLTVAESIAEAGTEYTIKLISNNIANFNPPIPDGAGNYPGITNPTITSANTPQLWFPNSTGGPAVYTLPMGKVLINGSYVYFRVRTRLNAATGNPNYYKDVTDPVTLDYHRIYEYDVTAVSNVIDDRQDTPYQGTITQAVQFTASPLFQFFAYYGGTTDLEMLPGANAIWSGKVFAAKDIYVGVQPGNTLYYNTNYFRTPNNVYRRRQNDPNDMMLGNVFIKKYELDSTTGAVTTGLDSSGNPIATKFSEMENRTNFKASDGTVVPNAQNKSGFDSDFLGWDRNGDGTFVSSNELKPFNARSMEKWGNTSASNQTGTVMTGADGVLPPFSMDQSNIQAFVDTNTSNGGSYNWDATNKKYVPAANGRFKPGYYNTKENFAEAGKGYFQMVATKDSAGVVTTKLYGNHPTTGVWQDLTAMAPAGMITDTSSTGTTKLYDRRESRNTSTTDINVSKMLDTDDATPGLFSASKFPKGIVMYMYREDATSDTVPGATPGTTVANTPVPNAFRLSNASALPASINWVSEDPVYIQGDYNTGFVRSFSSADESVGSPVDSATGIPYIKWTSGAAGNETTDPTTGPAAAFALNKSPTGKTLQKFGSAIMADAVNILSNGWADANKTSAAPDVQPIPKLTVVNSAFMSGVQATNGSSYGGGLENYVRFHENWGGHWIRIRGSFTNLFKSKYAKGAWGVGYSAPKRNWNWDPDFADYTKLPPGFPWSVGERRIAWWQKVQ